MDDFSRLDLTGLESKTTDLIVKGLQDRINAIILEGLANKGFKFNHITEAAEFIKLNCSAYRRFDESAVTYCVNGKPFLALFEVGEINIETDPVIKTSFNCSHYKFL